MAETIIVLLLLAVLLFLVTVIGHGIWLILAAFFRSFAPASPAASGKPCPVCGDPSSFEQGQCRSCGAAIHRRSFEDDRQAARRQMRWLLHRGAIDDEQLNELLSLLDGKRPAPDGIAMPVADATPVVVASAVGAAPPPAPVGSAPYYIGPESAPPPIVAAINPFQAPVRNVAAVQPEAVPDAPIAPMPPVRRASLADLLSAFMERRNIRWVELISGMLIVGSFIGLVISLRTTFAEVIPYFPALMFMLGAGFFHFVGLYTLHRWKLQSTSRAILIIATLLVPLSFMASIVLSRAEGKDALQEQWYWPAVVFGLLGFGAMNYFASRALLGRGWWRLMAAVMGASAGQLIVNRVTPDPTAWIAVNAAFALPLVAFLASVGGQLGAVLTTRQLSRRRVEQTFLVLGIALFGLLVALGLMLARTHVEPIASAVSEAASGRGAKVAAARMLVAQLSPSLCLAAALVLGAGLVVHQRAIAKTLVGQRMAGTAIAIFAGTLMGACVVLAWPAPVLLVGVGIAGFVTLSGLGALARLPVLHASAMACASIAWLVGFHLVGGHIAPWASVGSGEAGKQLLELAATGLSSGALLALAMLVGVGCLVWKSAGRTGEASAYALGGAALGGVSIAIAGYVCLATFLGYAAGPGAPLATLVLGVGAVALLAAAIARPSIYLCLAGGGLLWASLAHGMSTNEVVLKFIETLPIAPDRPVLVATLAHALVIAALVVIRGWRLRASPDRATSEAWRQFVVPLTGLSLLSASLALPFVVLFRPDAHDMAAIRLACVALVWLAAAAMHRARGLFAVFQTWATAAVFYGLLAAGSARGLWSGWLFDAAFAPLQIAVLALVCAGFTVLRLALARSSRGAWLQPFVARQPGEATEPTVDRALLGCLTLATAVLAAYAALPGVFVELKWAAREAAVWGGDRHEAMLGGRGWIALACVSIALLASLRERRSTFALAGLVLMAGSLACLVGAQFPAPATALVWTFSFLGVGLATVIWLRAPIAAAFARFGFPQLASTTGDIQLEIARWTSLAVATVPALLLSWSFASSAVRFGAAGETLDVSAAALLTGLHLAPMIAIAVMWLMHAVRERNSLFAAIGAAVNLAGSLAVFWFVSHQLGRDGEATLLAGALQWSVVSLGLYVMAWLGLRRRMESPERMAAADPFLGQGPIGSYLMMVVVALAGLTALAAWRAGFHSAPIRDPWSALGDWPAYAALLVGLAAVVSSAGKKRRERIVAIAPPFAISLCALVAASAIRWDSAGGALGCRLLAVGWLVVTASLAAGACIHRSGDWRRRLLAWWSTPLGAMVVILALVNYNDPWRPWALVILAATATVAGAASIATGKERWSFVSTSLALVAVYVGWLKFWPTTGVQGFVELCQLWLLAVVGAAGVWLAASMWGNRRLDATAPQWRPSAHGFLTFAATAGVIAMNAGGLLIATLQRNSNPPGPGGPAILDVSNFWGWLLAGELAVLLVASLWDRAQRLAVAGLYAGGAAVLTLALNEIAFPAREMLFAAAFLAAGYVMFTGYLWLQGARLASWGRSLGIDDPIAGLKRTSIWLPIVSLAIGAAVVVVEFVVVLSFDVRWMRYCAALAPLLLAVGIACQAQERRRGLFQWITLVLVAIAAIFTAWADVEPGWSGAQTLDRLARVVTSLSLTAFGFLALSRWRNWADDWRAAAGRAAFTAGGAALVALLLSLTAEAALFNRATGGAPVSTGQAAITGAALLGLIAALIWLALAKGPDPLGLSNRQRTAYVYAAQVIAVLFWAHIYLVFPEWFHGRVRPYWPYVAMAIAFGGIGLGELLRQRQVAVLAEPFEKTSVFLPIVPMLGIWILAAEKTEYWVVLFLAGLLYSLVAVFRRSFASALAAAVTGNAGLLVLLYERGVGFLEHPHFWMIPPALSVLGAAEANRQRLNEAQLTSVRYGCLLAVYVSSSCEIFLVSAGTSMASPMILAALAIAGVVAGIWLHIRAFLYLGAGFVMVSVVSMVWHAQRTLDQSWPWWAFGMGLGASIMAVFVMFERKRIEILGVIERLRQWEK